MEAHKRDHLEGAEKTIGTSYLTDTFLILWEKLCKYGTTTGREAGFGLTLSSMLRRFLNNFNSDSGTPTMTSFGKPAFVNLST